MSPIKDEEVLSMGGDSQTPIVPDDDPDALVWNITRVNHIKTRSDVNWKTYQYITTFSAKLRMAQHT